jgi:hypothetical protein
MDIEVRKGSKVVDQIPEKAQQVGRSIFALYKNKKYLIELDAQRRGTAFIDLKKGEIK